MWGFRQSTLLRVPEVVNRWLKSNKADMLWCATAEPARRPARQTDRASLRIMRSSCNRSRGFRLKAEATPGVRYGNGRFRVSGAGFPRGPLDTHLSPRVCAGLA